VKGYAHREKFLLCCQQIEIELYTGAIARRSSQGEKFKLSIDAERSLPLTSNGICTAGSRRWLICGYSTTLADRCVSCGTCVENMRIISQVSPRQCI